MSDCKHGVEAALCATRCSGLTVHDVAHIVGVSRGYLRQLLTKAPGRHDKLQSYKAGGRRFIQIAHLEAFLRQWPGKWEEVQQRLNGAA